MSTSEHPAVHTRMWLLQHSTKHGQPSCFSADTELRYVVLVRGVKKSATLLSSNSVCTHYRWWRSSAKLLKQLTGPPLEVAEAVRQQLQSFQQHVPLITALRNPGLRDRHWDKISAAVGCPVKADAGVLLLPMYVMLANVSKFANPNQHSCRPCTKLMCCTHPSLPLPLLSALRLLCLFAHAAFSLSRALQLGLPAHVAAIEEVSEYASKVKRHSQ